MIHEMEACASVVWRIFALGEIMNCLCCCCYFDQLNLCWANFHFQHGFTINSHRHIYWLTDTRTHVNALWANLKHSKPHTECYACAAFDCSFVCSFVYCWIHQFLLWIFRKRISHMVFFSVFSFLAHAHSH